MRVITILLLTLVNSMNGFSQIQWEFVSNSTGKYGDCRLISNSDILFSSGYNGKVYKLDSDGELLWVESVCDCEDEIISTSVETVNNHLLHLTKNGTLYRTDAFGLNSEYILNVTGDTVINDLFGYINSTYLNDQFLYFTGRLRLDDVKYIIRGTINLVNLESNYLLEESQDTPISLDYNLNNGLAELSRTEDGYRVKFFNEQWMNLSDTLFEASERLNGVILDNDFFYLIGHDGDFNSSKGLVYKLDYNMNIIWNEQYISNESGNKIFLNSGVIFDDMLHLCGSIGSGFEMSSYYTVIDDDGDRIRSNRVLLTPEGNYAEKIFPVIGESNTFIISGLSNVIDVGGTSIPSVYKLNGLLSNNHEVETTNYNAFVYPNPSNGNQILYINPYIKYIKINIYNYKGQIVKVLNNEDYAVYINSLMNGVYFMEFIESNMKIGFYKIVINN